MNYQSEQKKLDLTLHLALLLRGNKRLCGVLFSALVLAMCTGVASAQCVSLTTLGSASTQNFDTLSNTAGSTTNNLTITGWFMTESGGGARDNEQYGVDTGGSNTGDTYSYGAAGATDRALGGLRSGTLIPSFGACYTNNTGATLSSLAIAYVGEQWRLGTTARTDQINFEYSTNATSLTTGTWTAASALNFISPFTTTAGATNGNAAANRTALSSTIASLSISNGATFWIRWTDTDATGADDGLAVDDFSLTPNSMPNLTINDVSLNEGNASTTSFTFTVSLSTPAPAGGVTFDIAAADGTAIAPGDYIGMSMGLMISAGNSIATYTVDVNGDTTVEANETFFVNVTNVTGAIVTDGQGQGTIVNDDCLSSLTVNNLGDEADATPGNSVCETATGNGICTLRAAIEETNALPDCAPLTVNFSVTGTINLATELPWVEHPNLTIQGPGADVLDVHRNSVTQFSVFTVISDVAVINDLTVSNGNTDSGQGSGGGIYNGGGMLTINGCLITGNTSNRGGGVINDGGEVFINNSTIRNNSASSEGGGVYNWGNEGTATMTLTNCTISGNSVTGQGVPFQFGGQAKNAQLNGVATAGGLANYAQFSGSATVNLVNCTITGNSATSNLGNRVANGATAGGIFSGVEDVDSDANINLKNTLLAGNTGAQALTANGGTLTSQGNNLDGDGTTGFTNGVNGDIVGTVGTPINPLLATLSNYGGSTPTHALLPGSPAINAGTSTGAPANDQRNLARVGNVDIGAFESQGFVLSIAGGNNQTTPVNTNFGSALQVNVVSSSSEPVNGGQITFTPPLSGASATVAGSPATIAGGMATTGTVMANAVTGSYDVSASTIGATAINFALTNSCQTITVTNPGLNTGTVGTMFTATFTQMGGIGMTMFSTSSTLPTGLMLSSAGVLSGTPTQSGSFPITVVATDANNCMGSSMGYTLTISCPTITVNPVSLPGGVVGTAYNQTITPSGGSSANYTYSFTGTLPPGLTLSSGPSTTGTLSGNPTTSGNYNFSLIATDANGCTGNRVYAVTINQAPAITSANTTTFTVNTFSTFPITTTGFPTVTTIMQSGALPTGVMFTDNGNGTATLSGTPQPGTNGNYPLIFTATNGIAPNAMQNFTLVVSGLVCPSVLTVNDLGDTPDNNAGDGFCNDGTGKCTLRAAVLEANAIPACTPLTINFSVTGTINLATALPALDHPNLTIMGPGANQLDVHRNAAAAFRIFTINNGKLVGISGLSVTNGNDPGQAGGIYNNGTLTLTACTISGNTSPQGGGIQNDNTLTMTDCTVSHNIASDFAGGLKIFGPTTTLTNCTFSNNQSAHDSSAIESHTGVTLTLTNCTIANNQAGTGAGQTGSALFANSGTVLKNTIVTNNTGNNANIAGTVDTTNSFNNLIGTSGTGGLTNGVNGNVVGVANANTLLAALGNYGGPTPTIALLPGSPALNAGTASGAPTTDQRGIARPQGAAFDIGAFESRGFTLAIVSGNNQTTPPTAAFANALLVSVTNGFGEPVQGGRVTFTPPGSGPSATLVGNPATLNASGQASVTATANNQQGSFQVAAAANGANAVNFNLTNSCSAITLSGLPNGQAGIAYNQTVTAAPAGGGYSFAVTGGTLPTGLTLAPNGALTGTPTVAGPFNFTITATGFGGACNVSQSYTISITCPTVTLTPSILPRGVQSTFYSQAVVAAPAGTTYSYALTTNILPPGLTLNPATGVISGVPSAPGNYAFVITATGWGNGSTGCTKWQACEILITGTCVPITVAPISLPSGTLGTAYNQTVSATGGTAPHTFTVTQGALPPGLALDATTGALTGTPMTGGIFSFRITATAQGGCTGSRNYVLSVACVPLTFLPESLPNATMGQSYNQALTISPAGVYTFSILLGSLPPGYTLNSAGVLSGITNQTGTFNFTVKAVGGTCQSTKAYTLSVTNGAAALAQIADYDGDGQSDFALWSNNGTWRLSLSNGSSAGGSNRQAQTLSWGTTGDVSLLGDYDGDGQTDLAVFRPANGTWYVKRSRDSNLLVKAWGVATDVPVPGDYDGDGQTDMAVFRPSEGNWYVLRSSDQQSEVTAWGAGNAPYNDVAVPGDYDGDGKTDVAIFRQANGHWYIRRSSDGQTVAKTWGVGTDLPLPGDYDGDGKTDLAVWRGAEGAWHILQSADGTVETKLWGAAYAPYFDTPMAGDYDGDGKADVAVWRKSEGRWYVLQSSDGKTQVVTQGQPGDKVVTATPRQ